LEEEFEGIWLHFSRFFGVVGPQKTLKTLEGVAKMRKSLNPCSMLEKLIFGFESGGILDPSWDLEGSLNGFRKAREEKG
jgi:hypothetical protein